MRSYAYQYDIAGNRTQEQVTIGMTTTTTNWTYNNANQISTMQMGTTTYAYDGDSNRISQNALTYILDTQPGLTKVLGDSNGNRYMHSPRGIHAMYDGADWSYAVQDGLGSVRMEVGASVSASQNYTPYGEVMDVNGGFDSPFGFTGHRIIIALIKST
jgi:YD repeat-containing protein